MDTRMLATALRNKAADVRNVNATTAAEDQNLRDAADLLRVLANVVEGRSVAKAMGAPGDWGYDTDIGKAVASAQIAYCLDDADLSHL